MWNYEHFHDKPLFILLVLNGPNKRHRLNRVTKLSSKVKKMLCISEESLGTTQVFQEK